MQINIAVDGFSSCGKSTLTKQLAKQLNYQYIDTGAMYRAVTLYLQNNSISIDDIEQLKSALQDISISFVKSSTGSRIHLNGKDIEDESRSMKVSNYVSEVASVSAETTSSSSPLSLFSATLIAGGSKPIRWT